MKKIFPNLWLFVFAALSASASFGEDAKQAAAATPSARVIYLVRHGHYLPDKAIEEKIGPGISPIGSAQANLTGARLAGSPATFDAYFVSPMQRARDTAAVIGRNFPDSKFKVVDDLAECTPPTRDKKIMAEEKPGDLAACTAALERVFAAYFKPAQGRVQTELFVCHGNVIRYLITRSLGVDPVAWLSMSVGHASITKIRIEADGRFKVIAVGDVGHIPPTLLTGASGDRDLNLDVPALP